MLRRCQARGRATGWREHRRGASPATSTPGGCERSGTSPRMRHCESRPAGGAFRSERPSARCRRLAPWRSPSRVAMPRRRPNGRRGPARAEGTGRAEARIALTVERRDRDAAVASVVGASPDRVDDPPSVRRERGSMALEVLCQHVRRRPKRNQTPVRAIRVRRRERVDREGLAVRLDAALGVVEDELGSVRRPIRQAGHRPSEIGVGRRRRQQPTIRTVRAHRGEPTAATANHLRCTRSGLCDPETRRSPAKGARQHRDGAERRGCEREYSDLRTNGPTRAPPRAATLAHRSPAVRHTLTLRKPTRVLVRAITTNRTCPVLAPSASPDAHPRHDEQWHHDHDDDDHRPHGREPIPCGSIGPPATFAISLGGLGVAS